MNEETKELIKMNCKSFEFYKNEIEELEKQYFDSLDEAAKEVDEVEALMDKEIEAEENGDSLHHRINFNKLKIAADKGQRYLSASIKFEKEMKTMIDLSPNLMDEEIEYDGHHSKFLLVSDLTEELEQTIRLQQGIRKTISTQLKMFGLFIQ